MAYQFSTGFDYYTTAVQSGLWDSSQSTTTMSTGAARFGGTHSQGATIGQNAWLQKNLTGNPVTTIVHMAIKIPTMPVGTTEGFIALLDNGTLQVELGCSPSGVLQFYRGAPTTNPIGAAGSTAFSAGVWHHLAILATINNTTGVVQCWLDGVQVINSSGVNNRASANNFATQARIGEFGNTIANVVVDDVIILDGTGGALDGFLGDKRVGCLMAASDGSFTDFLPIGAATAHECVDEIPANDNTDYISSATTNARSSFNYEPISISANADFIVPWAKISKDDAGAHTVQLSMTDTGNDSFSSSIAVPSSYGYINGGAITVSPNGSAALSQTVINRSEFGIKIIS